MNSYRAPLSDMRFVLFDVLGADALFARLGFVDATRDVVDAVLEEGARFSEAVLAPLNRVGDEAGCSFDPVTGAVTTPPGSAERSRLTRAQDDPDLRKGNAQGAHQMNEIAIAGCSPPRGRTRARGGADRPLRQPSAGPGRLL